MIQRHQIKGGAAGFVVDHADVKRFLSSSMISTRSMRPPPKDTSKPSGRKSPFFSCSCSAHRPPAKSCAHARSCSGFSRCFSRSYFHSSPQLRQGIGRSGGYLLSSVSCAQPPVFNNFRKTFQRVMHHVSRVHSLKFILHPFRLSQGHTAENARKRAGAEFLRRVAL